MSDVPNSPSLNRRVRRAPRVRHPASAWRCRARSRSPEAHGCARVANLDRARRTLSPALHRPGRARRGHPRGDEDTGTVPASRGLHASARRDARRVRVVPRERLGRRPVDLSRRTTAADERRDHARLLDGRELEARSLRRADSTRSSRTPRAPAGSTTNRTRRCTRGTARRPRDAVGRMRAPVRNGTKPRLRASCSARTSSRTSSDANVAMVVLPLHGARGPGVWSTTAFMTYNPVDFLLGLTQSVWDVRRFLAWIRQTDDGTDRAVRRVARRARQRDRRRPGRRPRGRRRRRSDVRPARGVPASRAGATEAAGDRASADQRRDACATTCDVAAHVSVDGPDGPALHLRRDGRPHVPAVASARAMAALGRA